MSVSLEGSLTELHTGLIEQARETIRDSEVVLGRVALIYGNQLYFDFDEEPYRDPPKVHYLRDLQTLPDCSFLRKAG